MLVSVLHLSSCKDVENHVLSLKPSYLKLKILCLLENFRIHEYLLLKISIGVD